MGILLETFYRFLSEFNCNQDFSDAMRGNLKFLLLILCNSQYIGLILMKNLVLMKKIIINHLHSGICLMCLDNLYTNFSPPKFFSYTFRLALDKMSMDILVADLRTIKQYTMNPPPSYIISVCWWYFGHVPCLLCQGL